MKLVARIVLFSLLPVVSAVAEPERGRLPDGRAYRTAPDGSQVIDYIAELEMNVDTLKRQVNGLEYELESKQKKIERLTTSGASDPKFEERDILARQATEPESNQPGADNNSSRFRQVSNKLVNCESQLTRLQQKIEKISAERQPAPADAQQYSSRITELEKQLAMKGEELEILQAQMKDAQQAAFTRGMAEQKAATLKSIEEERASIKASLAPARLVEREEARPTVGAIDTLRGDLLKETRNLQNLIDSRDSLFRKYHESDSARVQIKPQQPTSRRGYSLQRITQSLRSADSLNELSRWKRDMREIQGKMKEDITLIRRMINKKS